MDLTEVLLTYLVISCFTLEHVHSCSRAITPPTAKPARCDYDITPITGTDVLRITFTYHRYQSLNPVEFKKLAFTEDDGCMCQEASEDGESFKVQLYENICPLGICPEIKDAYLTCNCTRYECQCFEEEDIQLDDACIIPGMELLPEFIAPDSRTCFNIGDEGDSRRKRQTLGPTAPLVWIFCVCNQSQGFDEQESIQICECPSAIIDVTTTAFVPTQDMTTDGRTTFVSTTEAHTTSLRTTAHSTSLTPTKPDEVHITTKEVTTRTKQPDGEGGGDDNDNDDGDDGNVGGGSSGGEIKVEEGDLYSLSSFALQCETPTTPMLTSSPSIISTVKEEEEEFTPSGSDSQPLRVLIILLAGLVAVILIIIGVVFMCRRQRKSYDVKFQQSRELDTPQTEDGIDNNRETTVIPNSDNNYGSLNQPSRQTLEPADTNPDVIPRGAPISYEDIDLQNRHLDHVYASTSTPGTHRNQQQGVIPYASSAIHGRHQYKNKDPVPYASSNVQERHNDESEYATAYSHTSNYVNTEGTNSKIQTRTPSAFPPYAKVNKPKNRSSVDTQAGNDGQLCDEQPHEYGKLKPQVTAAAGGVLYHKLDRGLNKDIVDNAL